MKKSIKKLLNNKLFLKLLDIFITFLILLITPVLLIYTKLGPKRLSKSREILKKIGIYPIKDHYYEPLFNHKHLKKSLFTQRYLPGINLNIERQISLMKKLNFREEILELNFKLDKDSPNNDNNLEFKMPNNSFNSGEAEFLYQIIRYYKPKNVIEIGCGESTKLISKALKINYYKNKIKSNHICIEPYENEWLKELDIKLIRNKVEDCKIDLFSKLEINDLLFIDSSHIIRPQGDVLYEYLEILPSLNDGVIVHIHDVFTPYEYRESWIKEDMRFWNEQYILEALITDTKRYEILALTNYLCKNYYKEFKNVCPYVQKGREPGSIYFKINKMNDLNNT